MLFSLGGCFESIELLEKFNLVIKRRDVDVFFVRCLDIRWICFNRIEIDIGRFLFGIEKF